MKKLKATLYSKFGNNINLEDWFPMQNTGREILQMILHFKFRVISD
jgi:hypothetical protein